MTPATIATGRTRTSRPPAPAAVAAVLLCLAGAVTGPGLAQSGSGNPVGRMALVDGAVHGTPPGGDRAAFAPGDGVVLDHLVETGRASRARMTLDPNGVLRVGQETRIRIDRATVDRATGASRSALSVLVGKIELALGSLFRGEVTVETPTASLGIKGTVLRVLVDPAGRTLVAVLEGVVEVTSKAGGTVIVGAGQYSTVEPGAPPLAPTPFDPGAGLLSPAAGGPDFAVPGEDAFTETPLLPEGQTDLPREPPSRGRNLPELQPPTGNSGDPDGSGGG